MATSSAVADIPVVPEPVPAKLPLMALVIAMMAAVLLSSGAIGGTIIYMIHSGRLPLQRGTPSEAPSAAAAPAPASHVMALEPMVANLADAGGSAYLKVALTLRIADEAAKKGAPAKEDKAPKGINEAEVAVRDTVLTVVGRQTGEGLLAPEGKEHLKLQLKTALTEHNPELKVMDLYFIDFLVQR